MARNRTMRGAAAVGAVLLGLAAAALLGAPLIGAILALLAGAAAYALAARPEPTETIVAEAPAQEAPELPELPALLDAVDQPLLIVRDRRVLVANAAAREVLGQHIEGADVRLAIRHPAAAERLVEPASSGSAKRIELVGLGRPESRWEMMIADLGDGSRLVRLTDRSEAFASEKMRGDFVANASHELRTPLATLLGFLETLQDEEAAADAKTRRRFIDIMFEEAQRMHRLVDDLISLSRIEAERFTAPKDRVDLLPLLEEVERSCGQMFEQRQSRLAIEGEAAPVLGDRGQLLQLFQNLIVNALKYGRSGTPVTVRFREAGPEMLRISIIDQGEGIAPEHLPRLTERFYRVDAGRSRAAGGTGLGLAIVKHIAQRHRGRVEIQSEVGTGTAVHVLLPRAEEEPSVIKES